MCLCVNVPFQVLGVTLGVRTPQLEMIVKLKPVCHYMCTAGGDRPSAQIYRFLNEPCCSAPAASQIKADGQA